MRITDMYPCLGSVSDKRIKVSALIKHEQKTPQGNWRQLPSLQAKMPLNYIGTCLQILTLYSLLRFGMSVVILKFHLPHHHAILRERIARRMWIQVARGPVERWAVQPSVRG